MNIFKERSMTPPPNRVLVAYCPDWSEDGYQICKYNESGFYYDAQPNDDFNKYVTHWDFQCEFN